MLANAGIRTMVDGNEASITPCCTPSTVGTGRGWVTAAFICSASLGEGRTVPSAVVVTV
ncbi:hypothetical protein D3C81_2075830 [compost metagenome]